MPLRKLRKLDGSAAVCIPKDDAVRDGLIDGDGDPKEAHFAVDRVGDGEYRIKEVDPDKF